MGGDPDEESPRYGVGEVPAERQLSTSEQEF